MRPPRTRPLVVLGTLLAAVTLTVAPAQAITGGTPTGDYGSPYVPTVRITLGLGDRSCTGTMISPETVVTAASCLSPVAPPAAARANAARPQHVPIGSVQPFNYTPVDGYVFGINGYVTRDDRDLALLHLDRPFENYRARLATTPPVTGQGVQINGYGRTTTDWVSAKQQVANATVGAVGATTFSVGGGSTTCKGDAGGPVYRGDPWDPEIVAVHTGSFQHGCLGETGTQDGTQETRLDDITDWIHQQDPDLDINCAGQPDAYATYPATKTMQAGLFGDAQFGSTWSGWGGGQTVNGWQGVTLAGPNKLAWNIHLKTGISDPFADGDLLLWHNVYHAPAAVKVGNGWGSFLQQANQNLVTVDSRGRIYAVNAQGELRMYNWDDAAKRWTTPLTGQLLDTGWNGYNLIVAAGDGVLYARTTTGNLYRFQYDFTTNTWTQRNKDSGTGWNAVPHMTSPGQDILYGIGAKVGDNYAVRFYRYYPTTDSWAVGGTSGVVINNDDRTPANLVIDPGACVHT